jgi:hypothetical protein
VLEEIAQSADDRIVATDRILGLANVNYEEDNQDQQEQPDHEDEQSRKELQNVEANGEEGSVIHHNLAVQKNLSKVVVGPIIGVRAG